MHLGANTSSESLNVSLTFNFSYFQTAIRKSTRENYPAPKKAELDSKPERHSVPWAGKILSTPEPEPQDDVKIQKEVELDDEEVEAPTVSVFVCREGCGLLSDWLTLHTVAMYAVQAAVKAELSHQSDSISLCFCS